VNQGEVTTLIGTNGAGKTTTLRTLSGQPRALCRQRITPIRCRPRRSTLRYLHRTRGAERACSIAEDMGLGVEVAAAAAPTVITRAGETGPATRVQES
ncbi:ATP-binding cassette domain-containing protein, partial [Kitasatospora purpeofusca]|uniref:ATP-binding cassette domain-containing protein n=1 Tax=Kitasatospora purpeofusca TaxID=67352 RepID=UPI0035D6BD33